MCRARLVGAADGVGAVPYPFENMTGGVAQGHLRKSASWDDTRVLGQHDAVDFPVRAAPEITLFILRALVALRSKCCVRGGSLRSNCCNCIVSVYTYVAPWRMLRASWPAARALLKRLRVAPVRNAVNERPCVTCEGHSLFAVHSTTIC